MLMVLFVAMVPWVNTSLYREVSTMFVPVSYVLGVCAGADDSPPGPDLPGLSSSIEEKISGALEGHKIYFVCGRNVNNLWSEGKL